MNETNPDQLLAFARMLEAGAAAGFVYDFSRFLLRGASGKRAFSDVFFWSVSGVILLFSLFYANGMRLRLYLALGVSAGWCLYFLIVSPAVRFFLSPLRTLLHQIIRAAGAARDGVKKMFKRALKTPVSLWRRYNKYAKYIFAGKRRERDARKKDQIV